jgi:hypothetical protein
VAATHFTLARQDETLPSDIKNIYKPLAALKPTLKNLTSPLTYKTIGMTIKP